MLKLFRFLTAGVNAEFDRRGLTLFLDLGPVQRGKIETVIHASRPSTTRLLVTVRWQDSRQRLTRH